jgi:hypothetical protein
MDLATALRRETGVPMRISNMALAEMTEALNRRWGDRDRRVPMLLQQERSGVSIEVERARIISRLPSAGCSTRSIIPRAAYWGSVHTSAIDSTGDEGTPAR